MANETQWTDAAFGEMSWHDCQIRAIELDQSGEWQNDLVFDIDFIMEWLLGEDNVYRFRIAPAVLRFVGVNNLKLDVRLTFRQPMEISSIERSELPSTDRRSFHWTVKLQNYPGLQANVIEFDAPGFTQELTGNAVETTIPPLTESQRGQSRDGWQG